jgi:hypothetical protein
VDKYVPVRVGASELVQIEIEQSSDALLRDCDKGRNKTRQGKLKRLIPSYFFTRQDWNSQRTEY